MIVALLFYQGSKHWNILLFVNSSISLISQFYTVAHVSSFLIRPSVLKEGYPSLWSLAKNRRSSMKKCSIFKRSILKKYALFITLAVLVILLGHQGSHSLAHATTIDATSVNNPNLCMTYHIINDWGTGFTANVTISNSGTVQVDDWSLSYDFQPRSARSGARPSQPT